MSFAAFARLECFDPSFLESLNGLPDAWIYLGRRSSADWRRFSGRRYARLSADCPIAWEHANLV